MQCQDEYERARLTAARIGLQAERVRGGWFLLTDQDGELVLGDRWQASAEDVIALCQEMRPC